MAQTQIITCDEPGCIERLIDVEQGLDSFDILDWQHIQGKDFCPKHRKPVKVRRFTDAAGDSDWEYVIDDSP